MLFLRVVSESLNSDSKNGSKLLLLVCNFDCCESAD